jgi:lysophospholipase L1-like esterase
MIFKSPNKKLLLAVGTTVLFLLSASNVSAECAGQVMPAGDDPLHMLVLGDSIMWGQGLKLEQKFWWRIKCWLQQKTNRPVQEKIEAHSGAAIEAAAGAEPFRARDGEVPLFVPTINDQVDVALRHYGDPTKVDLILLDGCINDVDVRNLLNATTPLDSLELSIKEKCGDRMQRLLRRVVREFPSAHVVVTNYYNMFSKETADDRFTRMLVKRLADQGKEARLMTDRQMREKLLAISERWYEVSTRSLAQAVETVNSELASASSPPRIHFAEIQFSPEHAFAAPHSLLWNFKFAATSLSGLRKAIVIMSLGTAAYEPNDQLREARSKSCKAAYKRQRKDESKSEKETREAKYLACRYASLGHPNHMGALVYAEAIKGRLLPLVDKAGWKRELIGTLSTH